MRFSFQGLDGLGRGQYSRFFVCVPASAQRTLRRTFVPDPASLARVGDKCGCLGLSPDRPDVHVPNQPGEQEGNETPRVWEALWVLRCPPRRHGDARLFTSRFLHFRVCLFMRLFGQQHAPFAQRPQNSHDSVPPHPSFEPVTDAPHSRLFACLHHAARRLQHQLFTLRVA